MYIVAGAVGGAIGRHLLRASGERLDVAVSHRSGRDGLSVGLGAQRPNADRVWDRNDRRAEPAQALSTSAGRARMRGHGADCADAPPDGAVRV